MPQCDICHRDLGSNYPTTVCWPCEGDRDRWLSLGLKIDTFAKKDSGGDYRRADSHQTFLEIARIVAKRSPDAQTQHGCVLVKNNRVVATGYNGWNADSIDMIIPNTRPSKYHFVIHAELNAILNAAKEGVSIDGAVAYITGQPCSHCRKCLIQCGIKQWYIGNIGYAANNDPVEQALCEFLVKHHGVTICQL